MSSAFYHGITKSIIGGFGAFFSNIHIIRRQGDTVSGPIEQDIKVPISYGPKSKWWQALTSDPARQKQLYTTLPAISYEVNGFSYDSSRKTSRGGSITCIKPDGTAQVVDTPAPWNIDITMYVFATNQEDALQIVEQIIPIFNPDITIKLRAIKPMNININVPIALNSVSCQDDYEGDYINRRLITYTLSFSIKASYFAENKTQGVITDSNLGIITGGNKNQYQISVDGATGEITNDQWTTIEHSDSLDLDPSIIIDNKSPHVQITEKIL